MTKILHVVHQYAPEFVGGTELYTQTLARYQHQHGATVGIFTPTYSHAHKNPFELTDESGIQVYRVPIGQQSRAQIFFNALGQEQLTRGWAETLTHFQPDIVHIQHLMGLPLNLIKELIQQQIPYVITLHDYWYGCANAQLITNDTGEICWGPEPDYSNCGRCGLARGNAPTAAPLVWLSGRMMKWRNGRLHHILTHAHAVIAPTHFVRQTYEQMGLPTNNILVLSHGIEIPEAHIQELLATYQKTDNTFHIGFIGSIAQQKGVHVLIEAVNQLPDNVRLTIYGGHDTFPDYVNQLKNQITHEGIIMPGRISREQIWQAIANFDVVVMPTLWYEASPLTIQEFFAMQTPIVASHIGAMPEKIKDNVDGMLFPAGDVQALTHILRDLQQNPQKLVQLKANIQPIYTMAQQVHDIFSVYEEINENHNN